MSLVLQLLTIGLSVVTLVAVWGVEHHLSARIDLHRKETEIMSQQEIDAITTQIRKGTGEVIAKIDELANAHPELDLSELRAAAQALDNVVPDAVVDPVPPADEDSPG